MLRLLLLLLLLLLVVVALCHLSELSSFCTCRCCCRRNVVKMLHIKQQLSRQNMARQGKAKLSSAAWQLWLISNNMPFVLHLNLIAAWQSRARRRGQGQGAGAGRQPQAEPVADQNPTKV